MKTARWTQLTAHSRPARIALAAGQSSDPVMVDAQRPEPHRRVGRAYRAGRLICGCVHVTVSLDGRLGLAPQERRLVRVRFCEPLDDALRSELNQLVRRRGAAARRAVERVDAIEIVFDDSHGERQLICGDLQPPHARHGHLHDIEFEVKTR